MIKPHLLTKIKKPLLLILLWTGLLIPGSCDAASSTTPEKEIIIGKVKDEQGHPLKDARVFIQSARVRSGTSPLCPVCYKDCVKSATSDAAGSFQILSLANDLTFGVLVVATGFAPQYIDGVDPRKGSMDIILKRRSKGAGWELIGKVVDENGKPVMGALVSPFAATVGTYSQSPSYIPRGTDNLAITDTNGDFTLMVGGVCDSLDMEISAGGLSPKNFHGIRMHATPHKFTLDQGAMITGRLMGGGKPVADAGVGMIVTDRGFDNFYHELIATTDKEGHFIFQNVPPSREFSIYGMRSSLLDRGVTPSKKITTGAAGTSFDVGDIELNRGCRITGHITLTDGKPVPPNTRVLISRESAWDTQVVEADAHGTFHFLAMKGEDIELLAIVKGYSLLKVDKQNQVQIHVGFNDVVARLQFVPFLQFRGKVLTPAGKPAADAEVAVVSSPERLVGVVDGKIVHCDSTPVHSDSSGDYQAASSSSSSANVQILTVHPEGYALVPASAHPSTITLIPWTKLEGTALLGSSPATNCTVSITKNLTEMSRGESGLVFIRNNVPPDASGRFTLERVPEGNCRIELYAGQGTNVTQQIIGEDVFRDQAQMTRINIGGPGTTVTGSVVLPHALKMQTNWDQLLFAENDPDNRVHIFHIHPDGSFKVENVPPGSYSLKIGFESAGGLSTKEAFIDSRAATNFIVPDTEHPVDLIPLTLESGSKLLKVGEHIPQFSAVTLKGENIGNKDLLGKVTLLRFNLNSSRGWIQSTIFPTCIESMDGADKLQVISFNRRTSPAVGMNPENSRTRLWKDCHFDPANKLDLSKALGVDFWDSYFVVGPDGKILDDGYNIADIINRTLSDALKTKE